MDRVIVYPGQIPLDTDILKGERDAMIGIAKLAHAILGDGPFLNALACTQTAPASMQVQVAPGQIYEMFNLDGSAYGSLAADTVHQILKQGLLMDAVNLSCPAPGTAGQSINYLVQVTYTDTDTGSTVLPYYNSANPAQAYSGPGNTGTSQNTVRQGVCTVAVKAGVAAATGTQATPAADVGYVGAYVVTVANGAITITAGNIATYAGAPFIINKLTSLATINSPVFTGNPAAPTQSTVDNTTKLATTAFVQAIVNEYGALALSNTWSQAQVISNATAPQQAFIETGAPVDNKRWDFLASSSTFFIRTVNDAVNAATNAIVISRSGLAVSSISIGGTTVTAGGMTFTGGKNTVGTVPLARMQRASYRGASPTTSMTVVAGDIIYVTAMANRANSAGTNTWNLRVDQSAGTAAIVSATGQTTLESNSYIDFAVIGAGIQVLTVSGMFEVTVGGTLVLEEVQLTTGSGTGTNTLLGIHAIVLVKN